VTPFLEHLTSRCKACPVVYGQVDEESELFTRIIYNLSGKIVGYQQYNWKADKKVSNDSKGRYWTYLSKQDKVTALGLVGVESFVWGLPVYLVEGQFEQATAQSYGLTNVVAVLCNNPKPLRNWIYVYPGTVTALCQNDPAGKKLAVVAGGRALHLSKDLDEYTEEEFLKFRIDNGI
jgi:hypothetical protein